jgi:hypothetical protein
MSLELGILRQLGWIDCDHLLPIDLDFGFLTAFVALARFMAFFLRRMIARLRLGRVGFDLGFALFAFQPVDLIPQSLDLRLGIPQICRQLFHQVQQPLDQLAGILVLDVTEVNVINHSDVSLTDLLRFGNRPIYPAFSPTF